MFKTLKTNRFIVLLLLITFLLRLPSLFEPYWYGDEGVYLTVGLAIKKGFLLYRDIYDNKTPMIYLLAAVANGTMFWFRFILMSSVLTTIYFFYRFCQNIFSKQEKNARITTIIFSVFTTIRLFEGNVANAEIFILLPTILGFYFLSDDLLTDQKTRWQPWKFFLAGTFFGIGLLFKATAVFDFLTLLSFWVIFGKKLITIGKREVLATISFLLPILLTSFFFLSKGILGEFIKDCFILTLGYLSSWKTGSHVFSLISLIKTDLFLKVLLVLFILFALRIKKNSTKLLSIFLTVWFVFSLFGATLSGRPYPHYLIQVIPPLSLSFGLLFIRKPQKAFFLSLFLILLFIFSVIRYRFWVYTTIFYYQNFISFATGKIDRNTYFSYFGPKMPQIYESAQFINENSYVNDKVFIWSNDSSLYALSKRLPATKFTVAYHIKEQNSFNYVANKLFYTPPALIVVDKNEERFSQLEDVLQEKFFLLKEDRNYFIYKKKILYD